MRPYHGNNLCLSLNSLGFPKTLDLEPYNLIWNCGFFVAIYSWKQNKKLKVNEFQIFWINQYTTHVLERENAKLDIFQKSSISLGCNVQHGIPYDGTFAIIDSIF